MVEDERFTLPAARRWAALGGRLQTRLLNNVWCGECRGSTTIVKFVGRIENGDVVLEGRCIKCDGPVARVIEGA